MPACRCPRASPAPGRRALLWEPRCAAADARGTPPVCLSACLSSRGASTLRKRGGWRALRACLSLPRMPRGGRGGHRGVPASRSPAAHRWPYRRSAASAICGAPGVSRPCVHRLPYSPGPHAVDVSAASLKSDGPALPL